MSPLGAAPPRWHYRAQQCSGGGEIRGPRAGTDPWAGHQPCPIPQRGAAGAGGIRGGGRRRGGCPPSPSLPVCASPPAGWGGGSVQLKGDSGGPCAGALCLSLPVRSVLRGWPQGRGTPDNSGQWGHCVPRGCPPPTASPGEWALYCCGGHGAPQLLTLKLPENPCRVPPPHFLPGTAGAPAPHISYGGLQRGGGSSRLWAEGKLKLGGGL